MKLKTLLMLLFAVTPLTLPAQTLVPADDSHIQYTGRFDFSNPKSPRYDWGGVSLAVRFKGKSLGFLLEDAKNNYDVHVDGKPVTVWVTQAPQTLYSVEGLAEGVHSVKIVKRTEALWGIASFKGLVLSKGGKLLAPPASPSRKIELIGDSFVCGYGNEADTLKCKDLRPFQNTDKAFGAFVARDLKAEYHNISYSGKGILRNYGAKAQHSPDPFPPLYDQTLCGDPKTKWDFSQWAPDAIIIHLGDNDFSTEPRPTQKDYVENYGKFLQHIREVNPKAAIFLFAPVGWPNFFKYVEEVVANRNAAGDIKVFAVGYGDIPNSELGCDYHPQVIAHRKFADILTPVLKKILDWK